MLSAIHPAIASAVLPVLLVAASPAFGELRTVGREFRPTAEQRTAADSCTFEDGSTISLEFVCSPLGCGWPRKGTLYAQWRSAEDALLGEPVLVAEGSYDNGVPYACTANGSVGVVLDNETLRVFDANGARGPAVAACDAANCFTLIGIAARQDGFLLTWSTFGVGFVGRTFDAEGQPLGASFLIDDVTNVSVRSSALRTLDGDVLISWVTNSPEGIRATIVRSDGTVVPAVAVNEFPNLGGLTPISAREEAPGRYIVAWDNPQHQGGWVARRLADDAGMPTTTTTTTTTLDGSTSFVPALQIGTPSFGSDQYTFDRPGLAGDDEGRWMAKWHDRAQTDTGYLFGAFASTSTDDARQWSVPQPFHAHQDSSFSASAIAGNGSGTVVAALARGDWEAGYSLIVRHSEDGGQSWNDPVTVHASEHDGYDYDSEIANLSVVPGSAGAWIAGWTEYVNYHAPCPGDDDDCIDWVDQTVLCAYRYSVSADDGRTWSPPRTMLDGVCWEGSDVQLATDGSDWMAVWSDWVHDTVLGVVSTDGAATWSSPRTLFSDVRGEYSSLALAASRHGRWVLAFSRRLFEEAAGWPDGDYTRVFISSTDDPEGEWSAPVGVAPWHAVIGGRDRFPSLAANEGGNFGLAWSSNSSDGGLDADIVAAFSDDGGESWSPARTVDTLAGSDSRTDFGARLLANGSAWAVAWRTVEGAAYSVRFAKTRGDCGNGAVDASEDCDDANLIEGDGCDTTCLFSGCGSLVVTGGEDCDDGNTDESDGCVDCRHATCGDGHVHSGVEECDDANGIDNDDCLNACTLARCGDGVTRTGIEICDDGESTGNNDMCLDTCVPSVCGDGYLRLGKEQCDDGNTVNGDGCTRRCKLETDCCFFTIDGWRVSASDALRVLKRAVGVRTACPLRDCDVNRDGNLSAVDALWTLRSAIGIFEEGCSLPSRLVLRMVSDEKFGSLQALVDYRDAAGHIVAKRDGTANCTFFASPSIQAMNWDKGNGTLRIGIISLQGIQGPTDLLSCEWDPVSGPSLHDFRVTVEDASQPVTADPLVPQPVLTLTAE